jgi:hypothetical protein
MVEALLFRFRADIRRASHATCETDSVSTLDSCALRKDFDGEPFMVEEINLSRRRFSGTVFEARARPASLGCSVRPEASKAP